MNLLQSPKVKVINLKKMSTIIGGRRAIEDSFEEAYEEYKELLYEGYSPMIHKISGGRYCIEW